MKRAFEEANLEEVLNEDVLIAGTQGKSFNA